MANTCTQIYIQVVFAVQGRQNLIRPERKEELQKYMTGIVTRQGQNSKWGTQGMLTDIHRLLDRLLSPVRDVKIHCIIRKVM